MRSTLAIWRELERLRVWLRVAPLEASFVAFRELTRSSCCQLRAPLANERALALARARERATLGRACTTATS
jgi:hypothetical protein